MNIEFYGATISAQRTINDILSLRVTGREQDWELELADQSRIVEMLEIAEDNEFEYDVSCALYLLILSSILEKSELGVIEKSLVDRIRKCLSVIPDVRMAMMFQWTNKARLTNK